MERKALNAMKKVLMDNASKQLDFETAIKLREEIATLKRKLRQNKTK